MNQLNFKKEIFATVDDTVKRLEDKLKTIGFGILTRIDFHTKIKEKLGKEIPPTIVLGACNPALAFAAFQRDTDITSLMPCNVVVREIGKGKISIEIAKPTALMQMLNNSELVALAKPADAQLLKVLEEM